MSVLANWHDHWQQFQRNLHWATHAPVCQRCRSRLDLTRQPLQHCERCLDWSGYELIHCPTTRSLQETTHSVLQWTVRRHHQMVGYKRRPSAYLQPLFSDLLVRGWLDSQRESPEPIAPQKVAVVPMPRHDRDLPNHLTPLVRQMSVQLGMTCWSNGLHRVRSLNAAQKTLNAYQRRLNLCGSLMTANRLPGQDIQHIVVVDDIRTTGASQVEAQRVFRAHFGDVCSIMGLTLLQMPALSGIDPQATSL